jgi:hypothetical protein
MTAILIGPAAGANVGIAGGCGLARREIEDWSFNIDLNVWGVSPVFSFDDAGFNAMALGLGPGKGISVSLTKTRSYTAEDAIRDFRRLLKRIRYGF